MFNLIATVVEQTVTGHFGTKTLRTRMRHFSTVSSNFCAKKRGTRHFGIRSTKSRDTLEVWTQDSSDKTQLHRWFGIRLKVGDEVSWCRNVLWPKCPAPNSFWHHMTNTSTVCAAKQAKYIEQAAHSVPPGFDTTTGMNPCLYTCTVFTHYHPRPPETHSQHLSIRNNFISARSFDRSATSQRKPNDYRKLSTKSCVLWHRQVTLSVTHDE